MILTLINNKLVGTGVREFTFEPEQPIKWIPGQYLHYVLEHKNEDDRGHERWFTISSAPSESVIRITTRISNERSSSFKEALVSLKAGEKIEADGPEGDFIVDQPNRNLIFVAGGIGITPYHSILVEAAKQNQQPKIDLLYANRDQEIVFRRELDKLGTKNPNLRIEYIIQPDRLDNALLEARIKAANNPIVYVSGPEPMVEALASELPKMGLKDKDIKTDYFPGYKAD